MHALKLVGDAASVYRPVVEFLSGSVLQHSARRAPGDPLLARPKCRRASDNLVNDTLSIDPEPRHPL
eukprot:6590220-Pyramimonas_sp.AAC.1